MDRLTVLRRQRETLADARDRVKGVLFEVRTMRSKRTAERLPTRQRALDVAIERRQETAAQNAPVIQRAIERFNARCEREGASHMRIL